MNILYLNSLRETGVQEVLWQKKGVKEEYDGKPVFDEDPEED